VQQEEDIFRKQIGLKFEERTNEKLHLEHSFLRCWNLTRRKTDQKYFEVLKSGAGVVL
jgi:hypothetical protein